MDKHISNITERPEEENISSIRSDLHRSKLWADSFWSRKDSHSKRFDPEIDLLKSLKFESILEIGAAYGRIAKKITEEMDVNYTGIEICEHFKPYYHEYNLDNKFEILFNDFFDYTLNKTFDIVLLPMNTFPTFSYHLIKILLTRIKKYLNVGGKFIFSTYKLPENINSENIDKFRRKVYGELLIGEKYRITLEIYQYSLDITNYGAITKNIQIYHRFDTRYKILEKEQFWTYIEYITHNNLLDLLRDHNFKVNVDDSSHSMVYIATLE